MQDRSPRGFPNSTETGSSDSRRDLSKIRILEFGDYFYFKMVYPERTTLIWTGRRPLNELPPGSELDCTLRSFWKMLKDLRRGQYDLVVVYGSHHAPWHPRQWLRSLLRTPWRPFTAGLRVFGVQFLRFFRIDQPLIAIDMADSFGINRHNFFLLDKANIYFKRELPVDRWHVLYKTAHPNLPTQRIRRSKKWQRRLSRLRPISIGVEDISLPEFADRFPEKTSDVFFVGSLDNSWVRCLGAEELRSLAAKGYRIDIPTGRLDREEYIRRMSQAWLAWSPAGFGWECFRHYEAPQCWTVPVINYPTILRFKPLEDGVHAFFYGPEPGALSRTIGAALLDKDRLKQMASAARHFVLSNHTYAAHCDAVIAAAFEQSTWA